MSAPFSPDEIANAVHSEDVQTAIAELIRTHGWLGSTRSVEPLATALADELTVSDDREGSCNYRGALVASLCEGWSEDPDLITEPIGYPSDFEGRDDQDRVTLHVAALITQSDLPDRDDWAAERSRLVS